MVFVRRALRISRRQLFELVSLVVVIALLTACGAGSTPSPTAQPTSKPATQIAPTESTASLAKLTGKVTAWNVFGPTYSPVLDAITAEFKKKAPNVEVEWVIQDPSQVSTKYVTGYSTGTGPDITIDELSRIAYAEAQLHAFADLAPYMKSDPEMAELVSVLAPGSLDSFTSGERIWALPEGIGLFTLLFVRTDWMDAVGGKLPTDWEEMTALAKAMTKGKEGACGYCIFGAPGTVNSSGVQYLYMAQAAGIEYPIIDRDGKPTFNTPRAIEVAKWMYRWQHTDKITAPDSASWSHKEFYAAVQAGRCAIGRLGPWNISTFESSAMGKNFTVITYPPMTKDQKEPAYQTPGITGIAMQAKPKYPDAVYAFLKHIMSLESQTTLYPTFQDWVRTDMDFTTLMAGNPRLLYFSKPQTFAPDMAYQGNYGSILEIISRHLNGMLADANSDPEKVMAAAYEEAMAKYKELGGQ